LNHLELVLRAAYPRARATLVRLLGDFDQAEDALQEAATRAMRSWPERGVPDNPAAWLIRTGRNYMIDVIRHRAVENQHATSLAILAGQADPHADDVVASAPIDDDLLRLVFTCCHPALTQEGQIALTLKTVAGLTVEEIGRAFLVSAGTMEKRLTRAKAKIRQDRIPYEVPAQTQLSARLDAALAVVYLIFNEGYKASHGPDLMRPGLCGEAIRLGRILARAFRERPEVSGLLALMLLQHSRAGARIDASGEIVPLDDQDRTLWNREFIVEGQSLVEKSLRRGQPGPYQIQAAIAAVHAQAARPAATDWAQIAVLYRQLAHYQQSPVITLNRAVAVARSEGPVAGITLLQTIEDLPSMQAYHHFHGAYAALLLEDGRPAEAKRAFEQALSLAENDRERAFLRNRIASLG